MKAKKMKKFQMMTQKTEIPKKTEIPNLLATI